jgi:hypothetical protein
LLRYIAFISSFAGPWRPLASRIEVREGIANLTSVVITTIVQHDISFYSANERFETVGPARNGGLECCREDGYFPMLGGRSTRLFMERRASIIFVDAGYRHSFLMKPSFRILFLNDGGSCYAARRRGIQKMDQIWLGVSWCTRRS